MSESTEPDDPEGDRRKANMILAGGFVALVGGGIWLAFALSTARKADDCMASGRRNCFPLDVPVRER